MKQDEDTHQLVQDYMAEHNVGALAACAALKVPYHRYNADRKKKRGATGKRSKGKKAMRKKKAAAKKAYKGGGAQRQRAAARSKREFTQLVTSEPLKPAQPRGQIQLVVMTGTPEEVATAARRLLGGGS